MLWNPKNIPIENDLAVLAIFYLDYLQTRDRRDLQKVVVQQRLTYVRTRYMIKSRQSWVFEKMREILSDRDKATAWAGRISKADPLAKLWPLYISAGIIGR